MRSLYSLTAASLTACRHNTKHTNSSNAQAQTSSTRLLPTPACGNYALTPSQTPGPFYSPNSPQRQSLLTPDIPGTRLTVVGRVLTTDCSSIANSVVDVWQTDAEGAYDNEGHKLRGHQYTDPEGHYRIETIVPGIYSGRTRHIHIKIAAHGHPVLTTQLYLPQEPLNEKDFLFRPDLLMTVQETAEGKQAQFDFVLS